MDLRPTLQTIADAAGVAKATVSLALRNHPRIPEVTRQRIQLLAESMGYRPDPALARIAAHRWKTRDHPSEFVIAFVSCSHPWDHQLEVSADIRVAAVEQGAQRGYRVEAFRLEDYAGAAQLGRVLFHRGIRGVLFGQIMTSDVIEHFPWDSFTCVGCHLGYFRPPVNIVVADFSHAVVHVWEKAVRAGYQRIGVALLKELQAVDLFDKVSAALYCQGRVSPELEAIPIGQFPIDDRKEFLGWREQYRPDIVLGFNATVAWWLEKSGFSVPETVAFASLDNAPDSKHRGRVVTGMNVDYAMIGRTAVDQIDLMLRHHLHGLPKNPITVQVPSQWIEGDTMPRRVVTPAKGKPQKRKIG